MQSKRATAFLLSNGWTKYDIDDLLTDEALLVYADAISLVSSEHMYYKVTETEAIRVTESQFNDGVAEGKQIEAQNLKTLKKAASTEATLAVNTVSPTIRTSNGWLECYVQSVDIGGGKYAIGYHYEWLIQPPHTKIDVFGLGHSTTLTKTNDPVYYIYKAKFAAYDVNFQYLGTFSQETQTPTLKNIDSGGIAFGQDLYDDDMGMFGGVDYFDHKGYIQCNAVSNNTSNTQASISGEYKHQSSVFSITPSISYPLGIGLTVSSSSSFTTLSPNPYLAFSI